MATRKRAGRPRSGQEVLTRERILEAALAIVDEDGVEALSMRRLAAALGVDPMAIYHHVPGKPAVLDGLVERVFGTLPAGRKAGAMWQEQVRAFARSYYALLRAHLHLVIYLTADARSGAPAALVAGEALYAALADAGLGNADVVRAADTLVDYLHGFALAERGGALGEPGERRELLAQLARLPPEEAPTMRRVLGGVAESEIASDVMAGLEIILAGIAAQRPEGRG